MKKYRSWHGFVTQFMAATLTICFVGLSDGSPAEAAEEKLQLRLLGSEYCVKVGSKTNRHKSKELLFVDCKDPKTKGFVFNNQKQISIGGKCVDPQAENIVWLHNCDLHEGKVFEPKDNKLYNPYTKTCLTPNGDPALKATRLVVGPCDKAADMFLGLEPIALSNLGPEIPADQRAQIAIAGTGRCLALGTERNKLGALKVTLGDCKDPSTQLFGFYRNNMLLAERKCLDPQANDVLWMYDCSDHEGKVFTFQDGKLMAKAYNKCVQPDGKATQKNVGIKLGSCAKAPEMIMGTEAEALAKVMNVKAKELPSLGAMPFFVSQKGKDYHAGQVRFLGHLTDAVVFRPQGAKRNILALMPNSLGLQDLIVDYDKTAFAKSKTDDLVLFVALKGTDANNVAIDRLPELLKERLKASMGNTRKFSISPGLSYFGSFENGNNDLTKLLSRLGVRQKSHQMWGMLSPLFVVADHRNEDAAAQLFKTKSDKLIGGQDFRIALNKFAIKETEKALAFKEAALAFTYDRPARLQTYATLTALGKKFAMPTSIEFLDNDVWRLSGQSQETWKGALGLRMVNLKAVGFEGEVKGSGRDRKAELSLVSSGDMLGLPLGDKHPMALTSKGVTDIEFKTSGTLPAGKIPLLKDIPGAKELVFQNLVVGKRAIYGEVAWDRFKMKTRAVIMKNKVGGQSVTSVVVRGEDLSIGKLMPKVPEPFRSIKFPHAALFISNKDAPQALKVGALPKVAQDMLSDIAGGPDAGAPLIEGFGIMGALTPEHIPNPLRGVLKDRLGVFNYVDGPLMVIGGIEGLLGKSPPNMVVKAALPAFKFPKGTPLDKVVSFDKVGTDFFIKVQMYTGIMMAGVGGDMTITVPELGDPKKSDKLKMRGEVIGSLDAVSVAGSIKVAGIMDGKWNKPFGLNDNLSIEDPAFVIGYDTEGSVEFGVGGNTTFMTQGGKKPVDLKGDFLVNINFSSSYPIPKKLGVVFEANELSLIGYMEIADSLFRGTLTGPMAKTVIKGLPPAERKVAEILQAELKKNQGSLYTALKLDKIPMPFLVYKDMELMFATPGAYIPGREDTLNTMGAVIAGKAEVLFKGKRHRIGETDNRLTLRDGFKLHTELAGFELGPIKLSDSKYHAVANLTEMPKVEAYFKAKLFGAHSEFDGKITPLVTTIKSRQDFGDILQYNLNAYARLDKPQSLEDIFKAAKFRLASELSADPGKWIHNQGQKEVKRLFAGLNGLNSKVASDLDAAKREVSKLDKTVEAMRNQVRNERRSATDKLADAQRDVRSLMNRINNLNRWIQSEERNIQSCNQTIRICAFGICKDWADLVKRSACHVRNIDPIAKIAAFRAEQGPLYVAMESANGVLEAIKRGTDFLPIDLDPRVSGPIAARDVAMVALDGAKLANKGASVFNQLLEKQLLNLKNPDIFALEKSRIRGSLQDALDGDPVLIELSYRSFGDRYSERMALSMYDHKYNAEQMSTFALGLVIKPILDDARKGGLVPHFMLNELEQLYMNRKAQSEKEALKVIQKTGDIQVASLEEGGSISSAIDTVRQARLQSEKEASARMVKMRTNIIGYRNKYASGILEEFGEGARLLSLRSHSEDKSAPRDMCLESTDDKNHRGASKVIFTECADKPSQIFVMDRSGEVHDITGRCLDMQERDEVWMYTCTGHPGMRWEISGDHKLYNPHTRRCLRGIGAPIKEGTQAEIDKCTDRSADAVDVRKRLAEVKKRQSKYGRSAKLLEIRTQTNDKEIPQQLCMETTTERNHRKAYKVIFTECNFKENQAYIIDPEGRIRDQGEYCLDIQENDSLWMYTCTSHPAQIWKLEGSYLKNNDTGACVRAYGSTIRNGADAETHYRCNTDSAVVRPMEIKY
ncbi:ricin-type beta-trefoil lectin domain protein [Magnetovibrio sp. PR-2]|uniref:RICIN domain-containing protein n=1 Tax=Magnetovibrio sp. PR-2 TaxID=3120356 RepID=UPI002FCDFE20